MGEISDHSHLFLLKARNIQELAKKKFEKIRKSIDRTEELKSDQKMRSNSVLKKPMKKPISRTLQDPVGSDFSSGATLATAGDFQNAPSSAPVGGSERAGSVDRLLEGSLADNNADKPEESIPGMYAITLAAYMTFILLYFLLEIFCYLYLKDTELKLKLFFKKRFCLLVFGYLSSI